VPVEFDEKDFELNTPDLQKVQDIFQELEFRRLTESVMKIFSPQTTDQGAATTQASAQPTAVDSQLDLFSDHANTQSSGTVLMSGLKTIDHTSHLYQLVNTDLSRKLLLQMLLKQPRVSFDTETTNLKSLEAKVVGCAFSW